MSMAVCMWGASRAHIPETGQPEQDPYLAEVVGVCRLCGSCMSVKVLVKGTELQRQRLQPSSPPQFWMPRQREKLRSRCWWGL